MPSVGKEGFRKRARIDVVKIPLPGGEPDEYVCLRKLSAKDLLALRKQWGREADLENLPTLYAILSRTLCDDAGTLLFTSEQELAECFDLPVDAFAQLGEEAIKYSSLDVKEKNSPPQSATPTHSANGSAVAAGSTPT